MKGKKRYMIVHLLWIVLSIMICLGSVQLNLGALTEPGPGFMPFVIGVLLLLLSIASLLEENRSIKEQILPSMPRERALKLIFTMVALWLYAILLPVAGFVLTTFALMLFLFKVIEKVRWQMAVIASGLSVVVCYFLFTSLGAEFPKGFFL
jgi:putative tricarboxylic transport membrane protein